MTHPTRGHKSHQPQHRDNARFLWRRADAGRKAAGAPLAEAWALGKLLCTRYARTVTVEAHAWVVWVCTWTCGFGPLPVAMPPGAPSKH